ncbi:short-chain dehydrogenase/reductase family 9C member 7-like [Littorina saxatilis]|uniref:Uncharacterized protein n=1 Tax=Littorina saxatilis TaxID=31220 RepID=A0AAN9GNT8_9CAEN
MFMCTFGAALIVVAVVVAGNFLLRRRIVSSDGKAVLITGCDRGFGYMLAVQLSKLGYRVFAACYDATGEGATKLRETSSFIVVVQLDVTSDKQVEEARRFVESELDGDGLWAVVNNAGIGAFAEAEWCSLSAYQTVMNVNWMGTVRVTKSFLPLVRTTRGRIINIASLAGRIALPGFTAYSSTKFAVVGFSDSLRREMFKFGVKVITIEPSLYKTAISNEEALTRQNAKMWGETSQEVRHEYGDTYFRAYLAKLATILRYSSEKIHEVVDDLTHAVTSSHPYTRYVPALFTNQLPSDGFAASPNHFQDFVLGTIFKVPETPACLSAERLDEQKAL